MIDTVFGIKVRMSGLSINRYRPIIGRLLHCLIGASLIWTIVTDYWETVYGYPVNTWVPEYWPGLFITRLR